MFKWWRLLSLSFLISGCASEKGESFKRSSEPPIINKLINSDTTSTQELGTLTGNGIQGLLLVNGEPIQSSSEPYGVHASDEISCDADSENVNYLGRPPEQVFISTFQFLPNGTIEVVERRENIPTAASVFIGAGQTLSFGCEYHYYDDNGVELIWILNDLTPLFLL